MAARVPKADGSSETVKSPGQLVVTAYSSVPDVRIKVKTEIEGLDNMGHGVHKTDISHGSRVALADHVSE